MRVVDTSAWIEWLRDSETGRKLAPMMPAPQDWLVPAMVQLELAKWLTRELGEDRADEVIAYTQICEVVPLDTEIAMLAASLCRLSRLATADAIVLATAKVRGADLLTCDSHFKGIEGVVFIAKD